MYSLIATIAVFTSTYLAEYIAKRDKLKLLNRLWEIILMVLLFGVIGARIYHVIDFFEYYKASFLQILNFRAGGLALFGGFIGGLVGTLVASKIYNFKLSKFLDLISIVLPIGQSIGRWGNYFNNELYGKPYNGTLKLYIPNAFRTEEFKNVAYYHPLFLYESVLDLALFFILFIIWKQKRIKIGNLGFLYIYIFGYGLIRYTLEPLRINAWEYNNINIASVISLILVFVGIIGLLISRFKLLKRK